MKFLRNFFILIVLLGFPLSAVNGNTECNEPIPDLFSRTSPSVVLITTVTIDPFKVTERFVSSMGSGFIISPEGLILTNSHVVFGRRVLMVTLDNRQTIPAMLMGADPILDLAVLRIPVPPNGLPVSKLSNSETLRVGEEVIAIGNPLGLE